MKMSARFKPLLRRDPSRERAAPRSSFERWRERVMHADLSATTRKVVGTLILARLELGDRGFDSLARLMTDDENGPGASTLLELHNKKLIKLSGKRVEYLP